MTEFNPYTEGKKIDKPKSVVKPKATIKPKSAAKTKKPASANKISVPLLYKHNRADLEYCLSEVPNHYDIDVAISAAAIFRMALHNFRRGLESGEISSETIEELHGKNR